MSIQNPEDFPFVKERFRPLHISIVIPVYMESGVVHKFHELLRETIDTLPDHYTIYYVNDGSTDDTAEHLEQIAAQDARVRLIHLVRNFGHQAALTAGLDNATGEAVISMDGDGQHPPALLPQFIQLYRAGYDIVQAQRMESENAGWFKRVTSSGFYWIINRMASTKIQPGAADFRLMSREAVESMKKMPEYHRFLRGMVPWMGYNTVLIPFQPPARLGGQTKYSLKKMVKLAEDAVFSFSLAPMRLALVMGLLLFILAGAEAVYVLSFWFTGNQHMLAPGWSSLMFMLLINSALLMINIATIGLYVGYIFQEVKHRPVYLIQSGTAKPHSNDQKQAPAQGPDAR
jgi:dolichol-phosphate mannosyltransferase